MPCGLNRRWRVGLVTFGLWRELGRGETLGEPMGEPRGDRMPWDCVKLTGEENPPFAFWRDVKQGFVFGILHGSFTCYRAAAVGGRITRCAIGEGAWRQSPRGRKGLWQRRGVQR